MGAALLAPVRALAAAVKPVTIRDVDIFPIEIPVSPAEHDAGIDHRFTVVKVETDAGVRGYSFAGPPTPRSFPRSASSWSVRTCSRSSGTCGTA